MAQHGWAALSKMSATSALRLGSLPGACALGPGVTRSTSRADAGDGPPGAPGRGGLCSRVRRRPVTGRARIWTAGGLALGEAGQGAEQRAERVDLVLGAQRVVLGKRQAKRPAGRHARARTAAGRPGRSRCAPRARPPRRPARPVPAGSDRAPRWRW